MKLLFSRLVGAAAVVLALASPAGAHRGHDAMSVVTFTGDGVVRVSHRFEAHDIEPALVDIAPDAQPSLDDPDAVAALEGYVQHRFTLTVDGKPVVLTLASEDIGASEVRIGLSGKIAHAPMAVAISSTLLRDVYPSQVNQVVVRLGEVVHTLRFTGSEVQSVSFAQ